MVILVIQYMYITFKNVNIYVDMDVWCLAYKDKY